MSVSGLCSICESEPAVASCDRCGALACELHYDQGRGLCADCMGELDGPTRGTR